MNKTITLILTGVFACNVAFSQDILAKGKEEFGKISSIEIDGSFVDVYVRKGDKAVFEGIIEGSGDEGDYVFEVNEYGDRVSIEVENRRRGSWGSYKLTKARIDITLPDGVTLDIDNSSGDVFVSNMRNTRSEIKASSGDITVKNIISNLELSTSSGDIEVENLVGDSDIRSTSGDQSFSETKGNITTESTSGNIRFETFEGDLRVEATSGDLYFRKGKGGLKARTTSGEIDGVYIEITKNTYFDSTSGNIEIDFENDVDELSFDLKSSSGDLEIGSKSGEGRFIIDRGGFKVTGVSSSGDQEYE
ncbi:MAG: DUF4097 family beta strand repeat-containing protein [Bacteroidota bacterium]